MLMGLVRPVILAIHRAEGCGATAEAQGPLARRAGCLRPRGGRSRSDRGKSSPPSRSLEEMSRDVVPFDVRSFDENQPVGPEGLDREQVGHVLVGEET